MHSWEPRMLHIVLIIWGFVGTKAAPLGSSDTFKSCEDQPVCSSLPAEDACKEGLIQKLCPTMCGVCLKESRKYKRLPSCESVCQNGGKCVDENVCECLRGFTGAYCEEWMCKETCHNGGTCSGPETCSCLPGFTGPLCQDVVVCEDHPLCSAMTDDDCKDIIVRGVCPKFCKLCESSHTHGHKCKEQCSSEFDPACGTNGITYDNLCLLELFACWNPEINLNLEHMGQCVKNCNANCESTFNPVCGTDGKTYENYCQLTLSACWSPEKNIKRAYLGECRREPKNGSFQIEEKEGRQDGNRMTIPVSSCHDGYLEVGNQCVYASETLSSWITAKETCDKRNTVMLEVRGTEIDNYLDNKGCEHPFVLVNGGCLWVPPESKIWKDAIILCEGSGSSLFIPKGNLKIKELVSWIKERRRLENLESRYKEEFFWIGGESTNGTWLNGDFIQSAWKTGGPNKGQCVHIIIDSEDNAIGDMPCSHSHSFVCQKDPMSYWLGATNTWTEDICPEENPVVGSQCLYISDRRLVWSDAKLTCENMNGRLLQPQDDQMILKYHSEYYGGGCIGGVSIGYQCLTFSEEALSWDDASAVCTTNGGRLATLRNPAEVLKYVNDKKNAQFWAGGSDTAKEGNWVWVTGEPFDQFPWASNQPDNGGGDQDCLVIGWQNSFDDQGCNTKHRYICESDNIFWLGASYIDVVEDNCTTPKGTLCTQAIICASDGVTYNNGCAFQEAKCRNPRLVKVDCNEEKVVSNMPDKNFSAGFLGSWKWNSGVSVEDPYLSAVVKVERLHEECMAIGPNGFTSMRCVARNLFICDLSHYVKDWRWVSGVQLPIEFRWAQKPDDTLGEQCMNYPNLGSYGGQKCNMDKPFLCEDKCPITNPKVGHQCLYISTDRAEWEDANQSCNDMNGELLQPQDRGLIIEYHKKNYGVCEKITLPHQCLFFVEVEKTWNDARDECSDKGAHLVTLTNTDSIKKHIKDHLGGEKYWTGGSDAAEEGKWMWTTGEPFKDFPWTAPEPNNSGGDEDCLLIGQNQHFNDVPCSRLHKFICEIDMNFWMGASYRDTDERWSEIENACITGNNYKEFDELTIDDCKEKCVNDGGINCQSIEYHPQSQRCHISEARSDSEHYTEPCYLDGWQYTELLIDAGKWMWTTGMPLGEPYLTDVGIIESQSCMAFGNYGFSGMRCHARNFYMCDLSKAYTKGRSCTINSYSYPSGMIFTENCMKFRCNDGRFYSDFEYNADCGICSAHNDPHFKNFDGVKFDWHGHSTYIMVSEGCANCPATYISAKFTDCAKGLPWATCIDTTYFQLDNGPKVTIFKKVPVTDTIVSVDGHNQTIGVTKNRELQVLVSLGGSRVPFVAWHAHQCLHVMGIENGGFMLKYCGWSMKIFAYPFLQGNVCGICGTWSGDNDLQFRNGTKIQAPPKKGSWAEKRVDKRFGNHWERKDDLDNDCNGVIHLHGSGEYIECGCHPQSDCPNLHSCNNDGDTVCFNNIDGRIQHVCKPLAECKPDITCGSGETYCCKSDEPPCNRPPDEQKELYNNCTVVLRAELEMDENQELDENQKVFAENCAFDQCVAKKATDAEEVSKYFLRGSTASILEQKEEDAATVIYKLTLCPKPYKYVKPFCYYTAPSSDWLPWQEAMKRCYDMGGILSEPVDVSQFISFLKQEIRNVDMSLWLGGSNKVDQDWRWVSGVPVQSSIIKPSGSGHCMKITISARGEYTITNAPCENILNYICIYMANGHICPRGCQNGGTCIGQFKCECASEWRGPSCEIPKKDKCATLLTEFCRYAIICGSDGVTYKDSCIFEEAKCRNPELTRVQCNEGSESCPGILIGSQCLSFSSVTLTWHEAAVNCQERSGRLAVVTNPERLISYIRKFGEVNYWIGGSDPTDEDKWIWTTGEEIVDFPWSQNDKMDEDCLLAFSTSVKTGFINGDCNKKRRYICEVGPCDFMCTKDYKPVCDKFGITHDNFCMFKKYYCNDKTVPTYKDGVCECEKICPEEYNPVCDSSGRKHDNKCFFHNAWCKDNALQIAICKAPCPVHVHCGCQIGYKLIYRIHPRTGCPLCDCEPCSDLNCDCGEGSMITPLRDPEGCPECFCEICPVRECVCKDGSDKQTFINTQNCPDCKCDCRNTCPRLHRPVCGSNGVTYPNLCELENAQCDGSSITQVECDCEKTCTREYRPVCSSDGQVHGNMCFFNNAYCKDNSLYIVTCPKDPCSRIACECELGFASRTYTDPKTGCPTCRCDCERLCPKNIDPVCGSDGLTYDNLCKFENAKCKKKDLTIVKCKEIIDPCPVLLCGCSPGHKTLYHQDERGCQYCSCEKCPELACDCFQGLPVIIPDDDGCPADCTCKICPAVDCLCLEGFTMVRIIDEQTGCERCTCDCRRVCTREYRPVCGSDGITYSNRCEFDNAVCENSELKEIRCNCPKVCPKYYDPVCGSDGRTYENDCFFHNAWCKDNSLLRVKCRTDVCVSMKCLCSYGYNSVTYVDEDDGCEKCQCVPCPVLRCGCAPENKIIYTKDEQGCQTCACIPCPEPDCGCHFLGMEMVYDQGDDGCPMCKCEICPPPDCNCRSGTSMITKTDMITGCPRCECHCTKECTKEYIPVCGSDGHMYSNRCMFENAQCENSELKEVKCECMRMCPKIYSAVCGSDGNTYDNECFFQKAWCRDNTLHIVPCRDDPCVYALCRCAYGYTIVTYTGENGCEKCRCDRCPKKACDCLSGQTMVTTTDPKTGCEECECQPCAIPMCICLSGQKVEVVNHPVTGCLTCSCVCTDDSECSNYIGPQKFWCRITGVKELCPKLCNVCSDTGVIDTDSDECSSLKPPGYWVGVYLNSPGCPRGTQSVESASKAGGLCCQPISGEPIGPQIITDPCATPKGTLCTQGIICASDGVSYTNGCVFQEAKCRNPGLVQVPCKEGCIQICGEDNFPVCGSDGNKYSNRCLFNNAKCKNAFLIEVRCVKTGCEDAQHCEKLKIIANAICREPSIQQTCPKMCNMCIGGPIGPACEDSLECITRLSTIDCSVPADIELCPSTCNACGGAQGLDECTSLEPAGFWLGVYPNSKGCPTGTLPVETTMITGGLCCQPIGNTPGVCSGGCQNGGTCVGKDQCICTFGWTGPSCEITTISINFNHTLVIDTLIGDIGSLIEITWRSDLRCGPEYLVNGQPATCNPNSQYPCCSPCGWCGNTRLHCYCRECLDYSKTASETSIAIAIKGLSTICQGGDSCDNTYDTLLNLVEQQRQNIRDLQLENSRKVQRLQSLESENQMSTQKLEKLIGLKFICLPPFSHHESSDECLYFNGVPKTWNEADEICKSYDGYLYIPNKFDEARSYMLINSIGQTQETAPFIGGSNSESNSAYKWVNDEDILITDFLQAPDTSKSYCVVFRPFLNKLLAVTCTTPRPFVCEKEKIKR